MHHCTDQNDCILQYDALYSSYHSFIDNHSDCFCSCKYRSAKAAVVTMLVELPSNTEYRNVVLGVTRMNTLGVGRSNPARHQRGGFRRQMFAETHF